MVSSMAHGAPMDIAGTGIANPAALIAAIGVLTGHPT
jgi:isocitrate/isopropylmalate dehydrogenase